MHNYLSNTITSDLNLVASRKASPSYPPSSMPSKPRPKISKASRRTSHPPKQRDYPTRQPTHAPPPRRKLIPEPVEFLPTAECAPNLPYFVTRTGSNELPVYHLRKRGGNLLLTQIRKIDGNPLMLRDALNATLPLNEKKGQTAVVNHNTGHVIVKGHWRDHVVKFLRERMF